MRKGPAGWVLAIWIIGAGCLVTACGQSGAVKQAVSSFTASNSVSASRSAPAGGASAPASAHSSAPVSAPAAGPPQAQTSAAAAPAASAPAASAPAAPAAAAAPTASPAGNSGTSGWLWLWIALAVVLVAVLTAWFIRMRRRHAATAADWRTQLIDAYAKGSALHDAMAAAETPEALGAPDAKIRWADIQRRADDFGQLLYELRESAHDDQERIVIADVLGSLQSTRSAMAAERSASDADDSMAGVVRDRLSLFGSAVRSLRRPQVRPA